MLLSPHALHCLKRKQLTNLCRRFGIKVVGKNADLIQRLQEYAASNIPIDSPTKGNVPILRHVKRRRQSDSSQESVNDELLSAEAASLPNPPLTPRTRQKRISDLVQAIEQVKGQDDGMNTDEDDDEGVFISQKSTIAFPCSSPRPVSTIAPVSGPQQCESTQPLRIIKALPNADRITSPLSTATILELSRTPAAKDGNSSLYPDLSSLPLPQGVSSDCLTSSSTLPSITSRQFSAAAASVLAEMNARLTAAGRSATSGSLATMSSIGNGTWQNLVASASSQGMSKSHSGRYEIHHERQFQKMDSIVNHYAARRVGAGLAAVSADKVESASKSSADSDSASSSFTLAATANTGASVADACMTANTSSSRRPRVDASTSTRSLAAVARSSSTHKLPVQRRPLPTPPVSSTRSSRMLSTSSTRAQIVKLRQASTNTTTTSTSRSNANDPPRAKRLRLAVSEDQDALQNTVLEIPPEKKTVVIRVTRPDRDGMPYKFSVASSCTTDGESAPTRAASSLRKTVIKATKGTFVGSSSAKKLATGVQSQRREMTFVKQQQQQAAMSRSISSRANLASAEQSGMTNSTSTRNKFTGVTTMNCDTHKPLTAVSTLSGVAEGSKHSGTNSLSSRFGGSIRSSVSQGLGRAEVARQARLKEIKARTKAALAGFGSQRNVSGDTLNNTDVDAGASQHKIVPCSQASSFSPSVMRPTIASLNRSSAASPSTGSNASASLPMLSAISRAAAPSTGLKAVHGAVVGLQRAATVHAGVSKVLTPCLTPRSSSLRHLRRVMRKQQKEADLVQVRVVAAENIAPGDVVPSVVIASNTQALVSNKPDTVQDEQVAKPSIRTVAVRSSPTKLLPLNTTQTVPRPAGPRAPLVATRTTISATNRR